MEEQIIRQLAESKIIGKRGESPERAMFTAGKLHRTIVQLQEEILFSVVFCAASANKKQSLW